MSVDAIRGEVGQSGGSLQPGILPVGNAGNSGRATNTARSVTRNPLSGSSNFLMEMILSYMEQLEREKLETQRNRP
jgi:hypothetical protein